MKRSVIPKDCMCVSFDVFDTLLKRSVAQPSDLFILMEEYGCRADIDIDFTGFAQKRREAALRAYEKHGGCACLEEIYEQLRGEYGNSIRRLMELEIQLELEGCRPNPAYVAFFRECLEAGRKVVLISDMYLPSQIIGEMLEKCGIRGYDKMYVSCEAKARKSDGALFRLVLNDLQIPAKGLFHLGDRLKSDCLIPISLGCRAMRVPNRQKQICASPAFVSEKSGFAYRTMTANMANCEYGMSSDARVGCELFGPLLYGFTQWLIAQLRSEGIREVYFMSRDGYTMLEAFEAMQVQDIRAHYIYCSRRSYTVPMLWTHPEFDEVFRHLKVPQKLTLRKFLLRVGLEPEDYGARAAAEGMDLDRLFEKGSFQSDARIRAFYETIREDVIRNSKREYEALLGYIRSLHMAKRVAVVDIGYHGTMQNALVQLVREAELDIDIKGYYVAVFSDGELIRNKMIDAAGYVCDLDKDPENVELLSCFIPLFEAFFLARHGSVKRFVEAHGEFEPEFLAFEYEIGTGKRVDELSIISEVQRGALEFIKNMRAAMPGQGIEVPPDAALFRMGRLGTKPTLHEAVRWGDFRVSNMTLQFIARPKPAREYFLHPKQFRYDFAECMWKIGFMRRFFRIPLPYDRIYRVLKKVYNKR